MEAKHTATPWVARGWEVKNLPTPGKRQEVIADCVETRDAEFIVRACNAHDDLVAALEVLHEATKHYFRDFEHLHPSISAPLEQARSALKKAGAA